MAAQTIADGVVRLGSFIVNWFLVADADGVTIVDAAVPGYFDQLDDGLRALGRNRDDVKALILTHAHADHVGVAERVRTELRVPIYVHDGDRELATTGKAFGKNEGSMLPYFRYPMSYRLLWELGRNGGSKPPPIAEVQPLADGDVLPLPGKPRVIHTPGHTNGHVVFVANGVLFGGDAICTLNPLTGKRGPQILPKALDHSTAQTLESLDRLTGTGATLLAPGHGDPVQDPDAAAAAAKQRGVT